MANVTTVGVELNTYRLKIREINEDDLNDFYEYAKVQGVGEMAGWKHHESIDETKTILEGMINDHNVFAIILKENNKMIGTLGLHTPNIKIHGLVGYEIGYVISKDYWGIGLATEAVREVLRWLFLEQKVEYVSCSHFIQNKKSERVIIKNNFKFVKEFIYSSSLGKNFDAKYYIITKDEYISRKEIIQKYDVDGYPLNIKTYRGEPITPNTYVGVVDILIRNKKHNLYLVTRRDINKETYPGFYEISGGAIHFGEEKEAAAKREVFEETGLEITNLKFWYRTVRKNMMYFTFTAETDNELDDVILQDGETIDYRWLTALEFKKFYQTDLVHPRQKERLKKVIEEFVK